MNTQALFTLLEMQKLSCQSLNFHMQKPYLLFYHFQSFKLLFLMSQETNHAFVLLANHLSIEIKCH
jgi:hypothetical protein